jgi:hypothetical protein
MRQDHKKKLNELTDRFLQMGLTPNSPRERIFILTALEEAERRASIATIALDMETQVHKRVEEALAKAYIKGK